MKSHFGFNQQRKFTLQKFNTNFSIFFFLICFFFLDARSVLQLKLTKGDISRGISLLIGAKSLIRKEQIPYVNRMAKATEQRRDRIHRRKFRKSHISHMKKPSVTAKKNESALNLALKKFNEKSVLMRSRRSVENNGMVNMNNAQIDDLHKFNDEFDSAENNNFRNSNEDEKLIRRSNSRRGSSLHTMQEQQKQLKFINSANYRDYAFDTAENEISEDDEFLQQYYGKKVTRDTNARNNKANVNSFGSFTDYTTNAENENDNQFIRTLHYGEKEEDNFPNDKYNDDDNLYNNIDDDDAIYDEYESYDEY